MTTSQQLLYSVNREGANYPSPTLINVQQYIFSPQLTKCEAHASVVVMDSSPQWRHRPVITLRIRDIQEIGCLSSYTPELLALTMALWFMAASQPPYTPNRNPPWTQLPTDATTSNPQRLRAISYSAVPTTSYNTPTAHFTTYPVTPTNKTSPTRNGETS